MMVESADGTQALLGRSHGHRPGMLTCLSGFIDQSESIGVDSTMTGCYGRKAYVQYPHCGCEIACKLYSCPKVQPCCCDKRPQN